MLSKLIIKARDTNLQGRKKVKITKWKCPKNILEKLKNLDKSKIKCEGQDMSTKAIKT